MVGWMPVLSGRQRLFAVSLVWIAAFVAVAFNSVALTQVTHSLLAGAHLTLGQALSAVLVCGLLSLGVAIWSLILVGPGLALQFLLVDRRLGAGQEVAALVVLVPSMPVASIVTLYLFEYLGPFRGKSGWGPGFTVDGLGLTCIVQVCAASFCALYVLTKDAPAKRRLLLFIGAAAAIALGPLGPAMR